MSEKKLRFSEDVEKVKGFVCVQCSMLSTALSMCFPCHCDERSGSVSLRYAIGRRVYLETMNRNHEMLRFIGLGGGFLILLDVCIILGY